ncbi:PREDICTED: uncharacterized protein LOC104751207 [Camelina sativa]|uniref:Uncharacterized protein LOC104751207 n=1 Tax=Camelina sativa TaxID=90675 RepID=A0ABM0WI59_CAMSA|nr:PREDICTED: uncharacterized protein LOC104751207 [Camelina sativa]
MIELYSVCGEWKQNHRGVWDFAIDSKKGGSLSEVDENITYKVLAEMVIEDFGLDCLVNDIKLSYRLSSRMNLMVEDSPPMYLRNDRQVQTFFRKFQDDPELNRLCVTLPIDSGNVESNTLSATLENNRCIQGFQFSNSDISVASVHYLTKEFHEPSGSGATVSESHSDTCSTAEKVIYDGIPRGFSHHTQGTDYIHEGKYFKNKAELMMKMRLFALEFKFEFRSLWSDRTRLILGCVDPRCNWKMRATKLKSSDFFVVIKYMGEHNCDTTYRNANHRQATAKLLGSFICSHFAEKKAGLKPKQIIERVRLDHGVHIQYKKAWRAKEAAQILVRGTPEDSYHNIAKWLFMAKERNPGSVVYLEMDSGTKFKYVFIAFGPSIRGFDLLRRVIAVDGTFLKGKFKGTLLVATAQDGDHHLYPIGFAIVDSENDKSWNWFFRCLRTIIPDAPDLVFVSDRASSIAKALTELYPASHHGICKYHLGNNIKVSFKGQLYLPLVESAAIAYTREEFAKIFIQIQDANPKLAEYLQKADFRKWARSYAPSNRYNIMTTNIAESFNSMLKEPRELPVLSLLETIRLTLTSWFHERREKAAKHDKLVTPQVVKKLVSRFSDAMKLDVFQVDEDEFEVKDNINKFIVHLKNMHCSCCVFDIDKIPCIHAIAAAKRSNRDENKFVHVCYLTETWAKVYAESIHPNGDIKDWIFPDSIEEFFCAPPFSKPNSGRPPKKRKRSVGEFGVPGSKSQSHKCSRCGTAGHNKSTCRLPI